jgi:hypothetical protein
MHADAYTRVFVTQVLVAPILCIGQFCHSSPRNPSAVGVVPAGLPQIQRAGWDIFNETYQAIPLGAVFNVAAVL